MKCKCQSSWTSFSEAISCVMLEFDPKCIYCEKHSEFFNLSWPAWMISRLRCGLRGTALGTTVAIHCMWCEVAFRRLAHVFHMNAAGAQGVQPTHTEQCTANRHDDRYCQTVIAVALVKHTTQLLLQERDVFQANKGRRWQNELQLWNRFKRDHLNFNVKKVQCSYWGDAISMERRVWGRPFFSSSSSTTVSPEGGDGSEELVTTNLTPAAPVQLSQMDITKLCHGLVWENIAS